MHDSQYMHPAEFAAMVAFLFAPPLLLAFIVQTLLFAYRRMFARGLIGRAVLGYVGTIVGSLVFGAALFQFAPRALGPVLRVRDIEVGHALWPVMPLTFVAVALAATASTIWVLRHVPVEA